MAHSAAEGRAGASPADGAAIAAASQRDGPGAEPPEMKVKAGNARAPASAEHDDRKIPQQRFEDAAPKQRAHNDSIPHQKKQEDRIPLQRQVDTGLPVQRKAEGPSPGKQHGNRGQKAPAPSGTPASDQSEASSAASLSPKPIALQSTLPEAAPSAGLAAYPAADMASGPRPGADLPEAGVSQASPPLHLGDEQKADLPNSRSPSQTQQGNNAGLQTGAPEAASPLQSMGMDMPGSDFADPMHALKSTQLTAGQEALRELLGEAAAAPAQHSTAGNRKAPASRYAIQQGMLQGHFDVWPAPAPCEGYYTVRALSEEHGSWDSPSESPR